jgi:hypothetical protein
MAKTDKPEATAPAPNLIWVGEGEPPHTIAISMSDPILIDATEEELRRGVYHPRAGEILQATRPDFKEYRTRAEPVAIVGVGTDRREQTPEDVLKEAKT